MFTQKRYLRPAIRSLEEDKDNIEEEEALTVPTIKPNKQKRTNKQPAVNVLNLRKRESDKKEANVWKDVLSGQHSNK